MNATVRAIEAGTADVMVGAYLDRLTRDPNVRDEITDRIEATGGIVWAADMARQSNISAGDQLTGTLASAVHRYVRRVGAERSHEAQVRAVARGVLPYPNVPPGYVRGADGVLEPDPLVAPIVARAFAMRADGATVQAVRDFLADHGIKRSYHGVTSLLASRVVLGEIHFGDDLHNLLAHEAIVDRATWQRVQRMVVSRGRRAKSERLLARLGVLRCASCNSRMVVASSNNSQFYTYRCPPTGDCERRVTISAELVEGIVEDAVRGALSASEGRASAVENVRQAAEDLESATAAYDRARRMADAIGDDDETETVERLLALRDARDDAQRQVDRLGPRSALVINTAADWDRLSLDERRGLIRATVERVTVAPGRGPGRVTVELLGE